MDTGTPRRSPGPRSRSRRRPPAPAGRRALAPDQRRHPTSRPAAPVARALRIAGGGRALPATPAGGGRAGGPPHPPAQGTGVVGGHRRAPRLGALAAGDHDDQQGEHQGGGDQGDAGELVGPDGGAAEAGVHALRGRDRVVGRWDGVGVVGGVRGLGVLGGVGLVVGTVAGGSGGSGGSGSSVGGARSSGPQSGTSGGSGGRGGSGSRSGAARGPGSGRAARAAGCRPGWSAGRGRRAPGATRGRRWRAGPPRPGRARGRRAGRGHGPRNGWCGARPGPRGGAGGGLGGHGDLLVRRAVAGRRPWPGEPLQVFGADPHGGRGWRSPPVPRPRRCCLGRRWRRPARERCPGGRGVEAGGPPSRP